MKRITKRETCKNLVAWLLVVSMVLPMLPTRLVANAEDSDDTFVSSVDYDEMNKTMPTLELDRNAELLASVDFNTAKENADGTFNGSTTYANADRIDLTDANVMNDALTLTEVQNIGKEYSIVFRAKLGDMGWRNQPVFALRKTGATKWADSIFIGVPGTASTASNDFVDNIYYKYLIGGNANDYSQLSDTNAQYRMSYNASPSIDGNWHTFAIVQSEDAFTYYIDGNPYYTNNSLTITGSSIGDFFTNESTFQAYVGSFASDQNYNRNLKGSMDYYQFYKGALTADQIATLSSTTKVVKYIKSEVEANYRIWDESTGTYTCVAPTMNGYLFAGWYKTEDCTEASDALKAGEEVPDTAYALFVPQHILNVKAQITSNLTNDDLKDDDVGAIRFITSVDSLNYQKIGFYFDIDGGEQDWEGADNKVYGRLYYTDPKTGDKGEEMSYEPQKVFCSQSKYFKTFAFYNLPESLYDTDITATPFWVTLDGTTVRGISETKTINERRTENWVYLAGNGTDVEVAGSDTTESGTKEAPYATLNYALANVEDGGVVCLLDDYAEAGDFSWTDHDKDISITGVTDETKLDFTGVDASTTKKYKVLHIRDAVTFSGIKLAFVGTASGDSTRVYANGNRLKVDEDVTMEGVIRVYGAGTSHLTGDTDITLLAGNYSVVYGGGDSGVNVTGNTNIYMAGNANSATDRDYTTNNFQIYGGSYGGTIAGDTHIYVGGNVNKSLNTATVAKDKDYAILAGGSHTSGTVNNTYITIEGNAKFTLVYGGGFNGASVINSTNVNVAGNVNADADMANHSHLTALYGGGNKGKVPTTNVSVTGNAKFNYIYGAGWGDEVEEANLTIGTTVATDSETTGVKAYGIYGGSRQGKTGSTKLIMNSGQVAQIFGGSYLADISGNTDVQLLGGTVTRRVYGGCYNDWKITWSEPLSKVTGNTNITISPNVTLALNDDDDNALCAISRYKETFSGEYGTLIFNNDSYDVYDDKVLGFYYKELGVTLFNQQPYHYLIDASVGGTVYSQGSSLLIVPDVADATVTVPDEYEEYLAVNEDGNYTLTLPDIGQNEQKTITIVFEAIGDNREG